MSAQLPGKAGPGDRVRLALSAGWSQRYKGVIEEGVYGDSSSFRHAWFCPHTHRRMARAKECAQRELDRLERAEADRDVTEPGAER